jgi:peptidoglycan/LPS O-acetylase OafA/YrhL
MSRGEAIPNQISSGARIPELDGARGMAALAVVIAHYFGEVEHGLPGFTIGWMGVNLFFVLSGFLIGSIILERKDSPNFFAVFYIRRTLRVFPAYFATLALTLAFASLHKPTSWIGEPLPALSYLTFTQNFAMALRSDYGSSWLLPTWTLAVEEQFYLAVPLLITLLPSRRLLPAVLGGITLGCATRALFYWANDEIAGQVLLFSRADILLSGVLAAYLHQRYVVREMVLRLIPLAAIIGVLLSAVQFRFNGGYLLFVVSPLLMAVLFAAYVLLAARGWTTLRFLRSPLWQMLGTISYSLYLIHQPVAGIMHGLIFDARPDIATVPQVIVTFAAFFAAIGLAWTSWTLMEAPLLRMGRAWRYKCLVERAPNAPSSPLGVSRFSPGASTK